MRLMPLIALFMCFSACDIGVRRPSVDAAITDSSSPRVDVRRAQDSGPVLDSELTFDVGATDVALDAEPPRDRVTDDCRFFSSRQGAFIPLNGDVEFVDNFADFQVEEVSSFSDLDVKLVDAFPDDCGEWREVSAFPDFTVELVDSFSDFDIRYVTSFPGLP